MKTGVRRELVWMTLPVVLIAGVGWWLSRGGKMPFRSPDVKQLVADARRPSLALQKVKANWVSPTKRAFVGTEKGCQVTAIVEAAAMLGQVRPGKVPSFVATDIVDEKGRSIKAVLGKKRSFSSTTTYTDISIGTQWGSVAGQSVPNVTYEVYASIPFIHLPRATKSAVMTGTIGWGTASPIPVKFEVLPAWMRRDATRLRVEHVKCRPHEGNGGSEVEVMCRVAKPRNPYVFGLTEGATTYSARMGIGYDPQDWKGPSHGESDDVILGEWSQRIESGDGRLNSLDLLRDHMEKESDRIRSNTKGGRGFYLEELIDSFNPLCRVIYAGVKNDKIRLVYDISGVPKSS